MINLRFHAVEARTEARTISGAPGPRGLVPVSRPRVGGADAVGSTMHCRLQVQRNGAAAKEVALRWSALTRPVAHASGASSRVSRSPERRHGSYTACLTELYRSAQHLSTISASFIISSGTSLSERHDINNNA